MPEPVDAETWKRLSLRVYARRYLEEKNCSALMIPLRDDQPDGDVIAIGPRASVMALVGVSLTGKPA